MFEYPNFGSIYASKLKLTIFDGTWHTKYNDTSFFGNISITEPHVLSTTTTVLQEKAQEVPQHHYHHQFTGPNGLRLPAYG